MKQFHWQKIQWIPLLNTQEIINIGVAVTDDQHNVLEIKLVDDLSKIKCFFGESVVNEAPMVFELIRLLIENDGLSENIETPQIKIIMQGVAFANSATLLAGQLMHQVVTAHNVKQKRSRYSPFTRSKALNELKGRLPKEYRHYIPENPYLEVQSDISAYIPMRKNGLEKVATILSSDYNDLESRTSKFYEAMRDLSVVNMASVTPILSKSAFLIKPQGTMQLPNNVVNSIESEIEMFIYQAKDRNFDVILCNDSEDFITRAVQWCS